MAVPVLGSGKSTEYLGFGGTEGPPDSRQFVCNKHRAESIHGEQLTDHYMFQQSVAGWLILYHTAGCGILLALCLCMSVCLYGLAITVTHSNAKIQTQ